MALLDQCRNACHIRNRDTGTGSDGIGLVSGVLQIVFCMCLSRIYVLTWGNQVRFNTHISRWASTRTPLDSL